MPFVIELEEWADKARGDNGGGNKPFIKPLPRERFSGGNARMK